MPRVKKITIEKIYRERGFQQRMRTATFSPKATLEEMTEHVQQNPRYAHVTAKDIKVYLDSFGGRNEYRRIFAQSSRGG